MRPTLKQLYENPELFVTALNEAGVENAQAKVMRAMDLLVEYFSMFRYVERLERDRTYTHQQEVRLEASNPRYKRDPDQVRRNKKSIGEYNRTLYLARAYLKRSAKKLNGKIAKWPDLPIDPEILRNKSNSAFVKKVLKKRMKKNRPKTKVLG